MHKSNYQEIDLSKIKTYSIQNRNSKVQITDVAHVHKKGDDFSTFWQSLPRILKAHDLHNLVRDIITAYNTNKPVIVMMGAHPIKCGLNPLFIQLMESGIIKCLALNGAGVIHDTEMAFWGSTSEDVAEALDDGSFGMVEETPQLINQALAEGRKSGLGFGESVGKRIYEDSACPNSHLSILASGYKNRIPITVHVAVGTDITHQHPSTDGATIGELSLRDFKIFCNQLKNLGDGGVLINIGSAVILPEVFLKALTIVRNLGYKTHHFITANFDMIQHYRPQENVLHRPIRTGGKSYQFTGHHEIMIPLLVAAIIEGIDPEGR